MKTALNLLVLLALPAATAACGEIDPSGPQPERSVLEGGPGDRPHVVLQFPPPESPAQQLMQMLFSSPEPVTANVAPFGSSPEPVTADGEDDLDFDEPVKPKRPPSSGGDHGQDEQRFGF